MSPLRTLGAGVLALLMPVSLLFAAVPAATAAPARAAVTQRVVLVALPQIVQFGADVANAGDAKTAFVATFKPITPGRRVSLQVLRGTTWRTVSTVKQNAYGRAQLAARPLAQGQVLKYRVVAEPLGDLPRLVSRSASARRWLTPTFSDEFSGNSLSRSWKYRGSSYEPQSLRACSRGSSDAVRVAGGAVRLSVMKDPTRSDLCPALQNGVIAGNYAYRINGHIGTDDTFRFAYGVAAARMKFPRMRGQHGSFWMPPVGGMRPDRTGHEIDVVESFGEHVTGKGTSNGLWNYVHRYQDGRIVKTGANVPTSLQRRPVESWWDQYHVFSVQWKPNRLMFRIDGKETWRVTGDVSGYQQFLVLSLLASDYELPLIDDSQLPQHMYVDWVRVWETGP
jgi:beta-glucanase (GH16 family)